MLKIYKKVKSKHSDKAEYENEESRVIHEFLKICSKSKVKKIFDNNSHIYIYTGNDLNPNCLQKGYTFFRNKKVFGQIFFSDQKIFRQKFFQTKIFRINNFF